jgi:hypothetical protein
MDTLDNPGWSVEIDLKDTGLDRAHFAPVKWDRDATDWIDCRVESHRFLGRGGASNLSDLIQVFRRWTEAVRT